METDLQPMTDLGPAKVDEIARMCHEVNRAYCTSLGDHSQAPWRATPEEIKDSARDGVRMVLGNPNAAPEESHNNWCIYKFNNGWRHGAVKDLAERTHPCLVAYDLLPQEQRSKDYLFKAVVRTSMSMIREMRQAIRDYERLEDEALGLVREPVSTPESQEKLHE